MTSTFRASLRGSSSHCDDAVEVHRERPGLTGRATELGDLAQATRTTPRRPIVEVAVLGFLPLIQRSYASARARRHGFDDVVIVIGLDPASNSRDA